MTKTVELTAGPIEYHESGEGPAVVLLHGLVMDSRKWEQVIELLQNDHLCIAPTLPLGAHRRAMHPDADLSLRGQARIVAEFLDVLDLADVTLCFNDWSCAPLMVADGLMDRVARLVITSCEAFENYPPGMAGRMAGLAGRTPGGLQFMRLMLLARPTRELPFVFGQMSKHGVPDALMRSWLEALRRPEIRRDLRKYVTDVADGRRRLNAATSALSTFTRPVLVVWDTEGRMMPLEHGRRFAKLFPNSRLVEVADSYTLIPIDQPARLAAELREFVASAGG